MCRKVSGLDGYMYDRSRVDIYMYVHVHNGPEFTYSNITCMSKCGVGTV